MTTQPSLPSWAAGATRSAIESFVERVTTEGGTDFVPPAERIAVFDNDGTLWPEKPMPVQLDFLIRRFAQLAEADPALREEQPYKAAFAHDLHWLGAAMVKHYRGDDADMRLLMDASARAFVDMPVHDYVAETERFFADAVHPSFKRPYLACGYLPMVELLRFLGEHDFTVYIASGGDRDFMRAIAWELYGVPPERVIGSSLTLAYRERDGIGDVVYGAGMEFFDDGPTKPVRIWSRIGRRPILACGNSNGDVPMLAFAGGRSHPALRLLLLHDDAAREFDDTGGAEDALARAAAEGWTVISMRDDWTTVFADAPAPAR